LIRLQGLGAARMVLSALAPPPKNHELDMGPGAKSNYAPDEIEVEVELAPS